MVAMPLARTARARSIFSYFQVVAAVCDRLFRIIVRVLARSSSRRIDPARVERICGLNIRGEKCGDTSSGTAVYS
jgi:hypothetical protein